MKTDTITRSAARLPDKVEISTRQGSPISNSVEVCGDKALHAHRLECLLGQLDRREKEMLKELSHGDGSYNCIGLVFAARRAHVPPHQVDLVLREDSYNIIQPNDVHEGDVVVWRDKPQGEVLHVGHVANVKTVGVVVCPLVISKWGSEGEFLHPPQLVPTVFGTIIEYYRIDRDV